MMKINSKLKIVLIILIGIIIVSSISVYATYNYFAKDISYTKADGVEISVEGALNELYSRNNLNYPDKIVNSADGYTITEDYSIGILYVGRCNSHNILMYNGKSVTPINFYDHFGRRFSFYYECYFQKFKIRGYNFLYISWYFVVMALDYNLIE